ncbi:MAG: ShlB/FhaC/HecB family hemolysin secretion/activation protein, partial [Burkholderia sp.]|nr:ShlB/FhaC/HecB family hemolysin secretion/activation protein [Burkholderia sp.]
NNQRSLLGTVSGYAAHNEDRYQSQTNGNTLDNRSQVRVLQLQLDYTSVEPKQVRKLSVNVAKAFDILGASKSQTGLVNGVGVTYADPTSLTFVRTGATVTQTNEWPFRIGTSVSLTGQYSPDSLPTSEQISFGSTRYALGYQPGEASGDSGWGMSLEVNRGFTPGWTYLKSITPYVAYDMARVYLHSGTPSPNRMSSVGIGVRFSDSRYYSLDLNVAKPIGDAPVESASRSPRINAAFSYQLN